LHSATFFTEEIKTTGTVSFNDDGLMSKYSVKKVALCNSTNFSDLFEFLETSPNTSAISNFKQLFH
jgi:hypothetical protein